LQNVAFETTVPAPPLTPTTTPPPTTTPTVTPTTAPPTTTVPPTTPVTPPTTPTAPTTSPDAQLSISSPTDGSEVQGRVGVGMKVSGAQAVGKVRLYVDDRLIATDYRAPYAFKWNTRSVAPGSTHTLSGRAYNAAGSQIGASAIAVKVASSSNLKVREVSSSPVAMDIFPDLVGGSSYVDAVLALAEAGVVSGFKDGTFGADRPVNRAQFSKMASGTLGIADGTSIQTPFFDLGTADAELYPHKFVASLVSLGAVQGTSVGNFSPWESVSRAQLVTVAVRALRTLAPQALDYPPSGYVSYLGAFDPKHGEAMRIAEYNGLLEGLVGYGSVWDPWLAASRGEVAQMLRNLTVLG